MDCKKNDFDIYMKRTNKYKVVNTSKVNFIQTKPNL